MIRILLILCLIFLIEINAARRRCINNGVLFSDKIFRSSIVVYGEAIGKRVYVDTDTELIFNITFRVDCILKGQPIESQIEITDAGIKAGRTACQWLDPGHSYVVFLEKWGTNINGYRTLDFQEHIASNMTYEFLAKTCRLTRILPLHSIGNKCPQNISMVEYCPHDKDDVSVIPEHAYSNDMNTHARPSYFEHGDLFYLQSNVTLPKDGFILKQTGVLARNYAYLAPMNGFLMIINTVFIIIIL